MSAYQNFHTLLSVREIQKFLNTVLPPLGNFTVLKVDGILGDKTWAALMLFVSYESFEADKAFKSWPRTRKYVAVQQLILKCLEFNPGEIDGWVGPATLASVESWQNSLLKVGKDIDPPASSPWPHERNCEKFYGKIGTNHTLLTLPYPMRFTWNPSTVVKRISVNKKCADSLERVLLTVREAYPLTTISELGLDLFSGCYNPRPKRGGKSWSMHAYACALDFYDTKNQFRWGSDQAVFAQPQYDEWWQAWESEHWISLGRERNFDWMHVQAARI